MENHGKTAGGLPARHIDQLDVAHQPPSDIGLLAWLNQAEPGNVLEYHRGFLALDRSHHSSQLKEDDRQVLCRMANLAMRLSDRGLVDLVQRRVGGDCFSYLAIARARDCAMSQFLDAEWQP